MTHSRKHVGFYAGDNQLLHAPHTGDVVKIANYNFKGVTKVLRIADGTTVVQQDLSKYFGSIKIQHDALAMQKEMRNEWN